jgi:predicted O-methyltransferase YrrM
MSDEYWTGTRCLEDGTPWLTPRSVDWLEHNLQSTMNVLEFGSGGSTIFFARQCGLVVSCETSSAWHHLVSERVLREGLANVELCKLPSYHLWPLKPVHQTYDVLLVDSKPVGGRIGLLLAALLYVKPGGIVIVDNYGLVKATLSDVIVLRQMQTIICFDDEHWCGKGTAIIHTAGKV